MESHKGLDVIMRLGKPKTEVAYWDECNKNRVRWYKKGKMKRILRKRWLNKIFKNAKT